MRLPEGLRAGGSGGIAVELPRSGGLGAAALAALGGAFAVRSPQAAVALVLLVLLLAVHARSRRAGLVCLWTLWLLTPALRRLLALAEDAPGADPLSLLPFLATGALALFELRRSTMTREARRTLAIGALGFLVGVPMGLQADPLAFGFGLVSYLAGLSAFALGWGDGVEGKRLTLVQTLAVALPPLALYGILQYFFPLPAWDANWVDTVDFASLGAPEADRIRVFSSLNSPGTLGLVLALGIVLGIGVRRSPLVALPAGGLLVLALSLTFVRSSWLALAVGLVVYAAAVRGRAAGKLVGVIAVCVFALVVAGGSNPTTQAFTERVTSLGQLSEDESAQDRLDFTGEVLPRAAEQPLGVGVGQAGLSVQLEEQDSEQSIGTPDNGYLALLYQLGPFGFLLVAIAMARCARAAVGALGGSTGAARQARAALLAAVMMVLVSEASGDALYGISGAIFWYLAGAAFALEREGAAADDRTSDA